MLSKKRQTEGGCMGSYLVTGGAGFIGSNIAERLLKDGHSVVILDNFSSGKAENILFAKNCAKRYRLIKGDIRDYSTCLKACKGVDYVLHQAALRSVPKSMSRPHEYNEVNIDGTVNMLKASLEKKIKRFVFASSSSVYGEARTFPQKETDSAAPVSPYALTKLAGEHYCNIYSKNYGLETVCLRYFNVFGPRQAMDDEYSVVIPKFVTCMLSGQNPPIHGDGKQSRDFTYIANVVEANILAATQPGVTCATLNAALGDEHSILELVQALNQILGTSIQPTFSEPRPGDVKRTCADTTNIKKVLGYSPVANFQDGLKKTVNWFSAQPVRTV